MRRYLGLVLACVLAAISASVLAMGLGEIRLNSYLNQRLDAEIELVSAAADEIESLEVGLAAPAIFERYGLERTALLNTLQFRVIRRPNGTAYVKVTSSEPIREPFLTLLVVADWSRGRLMREYTLLIDPPTFAGREQATPEVQVPAQPVLPVPQGGEPVVGREPVPDSQAEPTRSEEIRTGDVITIPPLEADAEQVAPIRREPEQAEPALGGNYGPIQRNETLWGIAQRLRPDESVTINQMMLALYRANPEAFQGNINRLKAGYILRVPEYGEISALARRDAFNEVKRQNEEWRSGSRPAAQPSVETAEPEEVEPELSLVAPEEDITADSGLGVGAGGEGEDIDLGTEDPLDLAGDDVDQDQDAVDLGIEDESADRLLDLEDESLQALQEQDELLESGEPVEGEAQEGVDVAPLPEEQTETLDEPVAGEQQEPVEPVNGEQAGTVAETVPVQDQPVVVSPSVREPDLVEKLRGIALSPLGLGIAAAVLVLVLVGFLVVRKRRDAEKGRTAAAMAEWDEENDDATVVTFDDDASGRDADGVAAVFSHGMEHEDTGTTQLDEEDATQLLRSPAKSRPVDLTETVVGGQAVTLDDNDPLSEADFHMAYGLYDQAAEVVQKAVERDPSRKDYLAKLAEIHFAGNNTEGFLDAARRLKALVGPGDSDWDNVAIMGQQIAPHDELFATRGATASVDLDFGSAAEEFDDGASISPSPVTADDSLDFDLELDSNKPAPAAQPAADDGLDFDLDLGSVDSSDDEEAQPDIGASESTTDDDFDFDLGELDDGASEEEPRRAAAGGGGAAFNDEQTQTEFDKALEELSAFVDTNLPEQDAGDAVSRDEDAKLNLDDYSFDEDADSLEDETSGAGEDDEDIGEIGTKLDLARAYIDMGDPDGARGILEEVLSDGDADQQNEARELLDQLS